MKLIFFNSFAVRNVTVVLSEQIKVDVSTEFHKDGLISTSVNFIGTENGSFAFSLSIDFQIVHLATIFTH